MAKELNDEMFEDLDRDRREMEAATLEMEKKYRNVLISTSMGIDVLADILVSFCHFGCFIETDYQMAQHNVGVNILARIGIFSPENKENSIRTMVSALPPPKEE